jgi:hypothetical protein
MATEEVDVLVRQIRSARNRSDVALAGWDQDAYDGVCESASHYYKELVSLVGVEEAVALVNQGD